MNVVQGTVVSIQIVLITWYRIRYDPTQLIHDLNTQSTRSRKNITLICSGLVFAHLEGCRFNPRALLCIRTGREWCIERITRQVNPGWITTTRRLYRRKRGLCTSLICNIWFVHVGRSICFGKSLKGNLSLAFHTTGHASQPCTTATHV